MSIITAKNDIKNSKGKYEMKKFKPNMMTTCMFALLEILAPLCVGVPVMILLMGNEHYTLTDALSIFPFFVLAFVLVVAFFCILNLLTLPFTKHAVFLFDDHFSFGSTNIKYSDITKIEIDSGVLRRMGGVESCCLDCYSGEDMLISIEHPSLLMSLLLWRRCKNAKLKYKRVKKLALIWAFTLLICVVLGLYGAG